MLSVISDYLSLCLSLCPSVRKAFAHLRHRRRQIRFMTKSGDKLKTHFQFWPWLILHMYTHTQSHTQSHICVCSVCVSLCLLYLLLYCRASSLFGLCFWPSFTGKANKAASRANISIAQTKAKKSKVKSEFKSKKQKKKPEKQNKRKHVKHCSAHAAYA